MTEIREPAGPVQKALRRVNSFASRVIQGSRFRRGCKHERVEWFDASKRQMVIDIECQPMEMLAASGFMGLCSWNAFCASCGRPILFSSNKPKQKDLLPNGYFR